MSVDTYLKGKDTSDYVAIAHEDVEVLLSPSLVKWARRVVLDAGGPRFWRRFDVAVEHEHGAACRH